ncbi:MAG: beta-N-acetylhexosaminidase [Rhodospirillales bacterium]|nr:beta-N-acetylhexosaminidase [Rhodospirillales bacterium]
MSAIGTEMPRAAIFGCAGTELGVEERYFFENANPLGFILFSRNVETPEQVARLVAELRMAVGREDAPVLIDQEGGRVQRAGPPNWKSRPPQALFGRIAEKDRPLAREAASINAQLIALELYEIGIDVNCLPVADVPVEGAHDVIGDRAFCKHPQVIAELGEAVIAGTMAGGVMPVVKHLPGHGRARQDSHKDLPRVDTDADTLRETDFVPFRHLYYAPWGMTAHIVFEAFDPDLPATLSETVIQEVIRGEIGFRGFLLSDDLMMKALKEPVETNVKFALDAGCDAVLHCNGELDDMIAVANVLPELTPMSLQRFQSAQAMMPFIEEVDVDALQAHLDEIIAPYV